MIHLIALSTFGDTKFAYHFSSDSKEKIIEKQCELINLSPYEGSSFSIRILKTEDFSFDSVKKMDPYFENVEEFSELQAFFDEVNRNLKFEI